VAVAAFALIFAACGEDDGEPAAGPEAPDTEEMDGEAAGGPEIIRAARWGAGGA
jgi:hypothetical protein